MTQPTSLTPPIPPEPEPPQPIPPPPPREPDAAWLLVLRHGQSEWNAVRRGHGWGNPPLSPLGEHQAERASEHLATAGLAAGVWASDLLRAQRTAEILATRLNLGAVEIRTELREHNIGEWDGLTWEEVDEHWPGARDTWIAQTWERPPGGECLTEFRSRVGAAVSYIGPRSLGERRLVIAHGGVVRALEQLADTEPHAIEFVSGRWFRWSESALTPGPRFAPPQPSAADL